MRRSVTLAACSLLALSAAACTGGAGNDKLNALLGDTGARMEQGLSESEFAAIPTLTAINLDAPLTGADYKLWQDHMQAFLVNSAGGHCDWVDDAALNPIVNRYRWDIGTMVAGLRDGSKAPDEVCRFLHSVRAGASNDVLTDAIKPEHRVDAAEMWEGNNGFWREIGYPGGSPDLLKEAVTEIGITGPQAADIIEVWVKASIEFSRLVNPSGTVVAKGVDPFDGVEEDESKFEAVGMKAWNGMMEVFTPDQTRKAWTWYRKVDRKFDNYAKRHHVEHREHDHARSSVD